ncbi:RDD family protein [Emticicia sp. BO119]|uniref:RDD family protein n=1 Tax=Emticicia sp. BO119 TaxID=2757768 RepID=UPI0015EFF848|nr:RDD family protein [Emticicia sp. BO119]MBA4849288.1 RDD family protein [Emticicia sp. BO119]
MQQKRIYAFLIDFLISSVPAVLLMDMEIFVWKLDFETSIYLPIVVIIGLLIIKDIRKGQSPGKFYIGLVVVNKSGNVVDLILRNMSLILFPAEALVWFIFDKRIGDVLFKTKVEVIDQTTVKRSAELMAGIFVILLVLYLSITNLIGLYIRQKQEYILTEAFVFSSKAIQEKTGEVIRMGKVPRYNISKRNGETNVRIETKIYGKKENVDLIIFLTKKEGEEWVIKDYKYAEK